MAYEYKPWRYGNRETVRGKRAREFRTTAGAYRDGTVGEQEDRPYGADAARSLDRFTTRRTVDDDEEESGGGFFGAVKDVAGDVGRTALRVLDVPAEYVGRPAFAIASGQLGADVKTDPTTGRTYREKPGFGDVIEGFGKALTQDPRETYSEARQAFHERLANPEFEGNTWARIALEAGSDPLMFVPAGTVGAIGRRLPQGAVRTALTSRRSPIGALGEGPSRAAVPGVIAGSAAGGELGERSGLPGGEFVGRLAGAVGGGLASARAFGRWGEGPLVSAASENTMPEGMRMVGTENVDLDDLTTRADLFQARDTDPGKPYKESRVRDIVEKYDPTMEEPGLAVRDVSSGDLVVIRGHHRAEAFRRLRDVRGGNTAEWQIIEADLTNPDHVKKLKAIAPLTNYSAARTNLRENVRMVRAYMEDTGSSEGLKEAAHLGQQEAADLVHLSTLPDDIIDRLTEGDIPYQNAAEVARIAQMVDLPEQQLRGAVNYYVFGEGRRHTRGSVRLALEDASKMIEDARQAQMQRAQTSMFEVEGFDVEEVNIVDVARDLADSYEQLAREMNRLERTRKDLGRAIGEDAEPELVAARQSIEANLEEQIATIREHLEDSRGRIRARLAGEEAGTPAGRGEGLEGEARPADEALPGQEGLFGEAADARVPDDLAGLSEAELRDLQANAPVASPELQRVNEEIARRGASVLPPAAGPQIAGARTTDVGVERPVPGAAPVARGLDEGAEQPRLGEAETPPGEPPIETRGRGNQPGFGEEPSVDLLNTVPRATTISRAQKRAGKLPNKLGAKLKNALGRLESEDVREKVNPFVREKQRIDQQIAHTAEALVTLERIALKVAGLETRQVDGVAHLFANGRDMGLFEDIIEGTTEQARRAYAQLTPEQHQAIAMIAKTNRDVNGTIRFHGADPRIDDEIAGDYFGRRAIAREYTNEAGETVRVETSRKGPATSKSRVMESIEQGLEEGFKYEDPWEARTAILRGKLRDAEDAYLKKSLKPLAKKDIGSTFGLSQARGVRAVEGSWFDPEVAKRIEEGLNSAQRGAAERTLQAINNVLTPLRASFDLSATFQQGLRMWLTNPAAASKYWWTVMRSLVDDSVYDNALLKMHQSGPGLDYHVRMGARFTGESVGGEFLFSGGALGRASKLPVAGKVLAGGLSTSNKAFGRTLNLYRLHSGNAQYARLRATGLEGADLDAAMTASWKGINRAYGWTDTQPTTIEQAAIFAPRYTRASVETIIKAISDGGIEGKMARTHMGLMLAEGAALVWLLNTARGHETEWDPTNPNFLRIRDVAGLDVSPFGTYNTLFRAIAQTAAGTPFERGADLSAPWKFVEGKMSPSLKLVYEPFIKQATYLGEPQDVLGDPLGVLGEQAKSTLPFGVQNLLQEGPAAAGVGTLGVSSTPVTPAEKRDFARDRLSQEMFGKPYDDLSGAEKSQVNETEEVSGHQEDVDRNTLSRENERSTATQARLDADRKIRELSSALERGEITGNEWREQYQQIQTELRAVRDTIDFGGDEDVIDGWFALWDQAELPDGRIDYARLEGLQAQYEKEHPEIRDELDKVTGTRDNATVREYREARDLARQYYSMPAFKGMNLEMSQRASAMLAAASDMVAFGFASDRQEALQRLMAEDPAGVLLARQALRMGPNPMREMFRRNPGNRLFGKFYGDVPTSVAG